MEEIDIEYGMPTVDVAMPLLSARLPSRLRDVQYVDLRDEYAPAFRQLLLRIREGSNVVTPL